MKKLFIITGTSSGLGKAFVEAIDEPDNELILISRNVQNSPDCKFAKTSKIKMDFSSLVPEKDIVQIFQNKNFSQVHLILNSGAVEPVEKIGTYDFKDFLSSFHINFTNHAHLSHLFVKLYQDVDAFKSIIHVSTGAATNAYASWSAYCSSKTALAMFGKCLNLEQKEKRHPIHMIKFGPGVMDTAMQEVLRTKTKKTFPMIDKFLNLYQNKELKDPKIIASKLKLLCDRKITKEEILYNEV